MSSELRSTLRVESIACHRGGRQLFEQLSFELQAGEIQQVIGPNGSGKTSLLRILCGLRPPDSGHIWWCNESIAEADDTYREAFIYLGFQSGLKLELTTLENLQFAQTLARSAKLSPQQALEYTRLDGYQNTPCRQLSTGQLRRVALVRLLMLGVKLWILDEPLTGLDQASRMDFENALFKHVAMGGMVILTTHHPLTDRGGVLRHLELSQ